MTTATTNTAPKVGDIWDCQWGYDETRVEFYIVRRVSEHSVWLQRVGANVTDDNGIYRYKTASAEKAVGEVFRRKLHKGDRHGTPWFGAEINSYKWVSPWDGQATLDSGGSR